MLTRGSCTVMAPVCAETSAAPMEPKKSAANSALTVSVDSFIENLPEVFITNIALYFGHGMAAGA